VPTHVHERRVKLARARQKIEAATGESPTREELAAATGLELRHVEEALSAVEASVSLNQRIGSDADGELGELFADPTAADPAEEAGESLERQDLRKALEQLAPRERRLVELRFGLDGEPHSLESIGKELGLTRERVRQLEADSLAKLRNQLSLDDLANAA
jgi:RNA polymerase primary sigma factor